MKYFITLIFCLSLTITQTFGQDPFLIDANNIYGNSVPPNLQISYNFYTPNVSTDGCLFTWTATNSSTLTFSGVTNTNTFPLKWSNTNGNATLKVKTSGCSDSNANGLEATYTAPIRYLGDVGAISMNGSTANPQSLDCGTQTVTLSVGNVTNATNYNWNVSGLSGWAITSGQGTNSVTASVSAGGEGTIQVTATRSDVSSYSSVATKTVTRPNTLSSVTLSGNSQGCSSTSSTYSLANVPSGATTSWTTTGPLSVSSSSTSSATVDFGSSSGTGTLSALVTDVCGHTVTLTKTIGIGNPTAPTSLVVRMGASTSQICLNQETGIQVGHTNQTALGITAYTWNFGGWSSYFTGYDGTNPFTNVALFNLTSSAPSSQSISVAAQNACGTGAYTSGTFYTVSCGSLRLVYPNPATDVVSLNFDEKSVKLPEEIIVYDELSQKAVYSLPYEKLVASLDNDNTLTIPVKDFPRGTYYVHIVTKEQTEKVRLELK
ncbi:MAG: T9SS type A sorting domain-containing protein [Siphonobacter sp.]